MSDELQAATWVFLFAASLVVALLWWLVKGE